MATEYADSIIHGSDSYSGSVAMGSDEFIERQPPAPPPEQQQSSQPQSRPPRRQKILPPDSPLLSSQLRQQLSPPRTLPQRRKRLAPRPPKQEQQQSTTRPLSQLQKKSTMDGQIFSQDDGIEWPLSICIDHHNSTLIVSMAGKNHIKVFDIIQ